MLSSTSKPQALVSLALAYKQMFVSRNSRRGQPEKAAVKTPAERRLALQKLVPSWPGWTIPRWFDQAAARYPDRPAILTTTESPSYTELRLRSLAAANGLVALGLEPGDHVALVMANYPEFLIAKLAIARAGCVAVPINYQLRKDELEYIVAQSGCRALIGMAQFRGRDYAADFLALRDAIPALQHLVVRDDGDALPAGLMPFASLGALQTDATAREVDRRQAVAAHGDWSDIVYTSGTTGRPKGAILTHDMVLRSAWSSALTRAFEDGRRVQFALPMYHVFGYVECWVATVFVGGAVIPHTAFDAAAMLDAADRFAATDMVCVPVMTHDLITATRLRGHAPRTLNAYFNSGGFNLPTVWDEIRDVLAAREIHTAYGMTETTASTVCTRADDGDRPLLATNGGYKLAGAAGDPRISGRVAEYRVVDPENGIPLPLDTDGELQVRGPVVTCGYYAKPEETAAAFTEDGWFRTGDIGRLLEGGYLRLTGRIKEAYRCGGEMVMPREIEDLLSGFPGVAQVLAVGVPDHRMGEVGCLCIVAAAGCQPDCAAMLAHCAARLARFKVPRHALLFAAQDIPLTATGRPQKFLLAKLAADRLAQQTGGVQSGLPITPSATSVA